MRDLVKMVSVLFISCGLSAASLAVMNAITEDPIKVHVEQLKQVALRKVFADADKFDGGPVRAWLVLCKGQRVGHVFLAMEKVDSHPKTVLAGRDFRGTTAGRQVITDDTEKPLSDIEIDEKKLREVFPNGEEFKSLAVKGVWTASREEKEVGRAFETWVQGYSGPITLMFGMDAGGAITGLRVLSHTETPGLGAKITKPQFTDQFKGKRPEQLILKKTDPARGQIDAITGATISSRAVTKALSTTIEAFRTEKAGGEK